jgi:hypothetical protein
MRKKRGPIRTGKADVDPSLPSHTKGIRRGNAPGSYDKMTGHRPDGTSTAARSTGINAEDRDPISDDMPNLSPA